jgi:hypothetical protein
MFASVSQLKIKYYEIDVPEIGCVVAINKHVW